jgi:hypothetical protein
MSTIPQPAPKSDAAGASPPVEQHYWLWVLCLLGLDYFSTLAYQPSITFHETERLGPIATAVVVLITLFGALPVYCYLAGRSPTGQGSLGVVEKLIRGWRGKTVVLILLGFAATDFTMLKSLSLADASVHVLSNQDSVRTDHARTMTRWVKDCTTEYCGEDYAEHVNEQLIVTILLGAVSFIFWFILRKGFNRKVLFLAVPLVGLYLLMTAIIIGGGIWLLVQHPEIVTEWLNHMERGEFRATQAGRASDGWDSVVFWSLLALPNLALGLSGFELSMILMPQVEGKSGEHPPRTRIRNTRKVLIVAAIIMGAFLLGAVFVTTLLIPPAALAQHGDANHRALAYLAHGGNLTAADSVLPIAGFWFGTAYDIVTVLILCLAGTSVMTALAVLLPHFMLRFGMEFRWGSRWGLMLILFAGINLAVTLLFNADVDDQRGAYATGVLVLIACAAVVTVLEKKRTQELTPGVSFFYLINFGYFTLIAFIFMATMFAVAMRSTSGLGISLCFIAAILAMSITSRAWRADESRTVGFAFKDEQSRFLWDSLRLTDFPILVPVRPGRERQDAKEREIRTHHHLSHEADIVFLEVYLDDPSDFFQKLMIEVVRENNRYVIKVTNCVSVAHAIAAIALEMSRSSKPPSMHFGWPEQDILSASWSYLAFGEGNLPWKVQELVLRAEPDPEKRPRVIVG